jgi:endogenous inhibitor of DNA gyrase (YacG/DUF329 family)
MTSPPQEITLQCPRCGERYRNWFRASMNLNLEHFDEEDIRDASTATCPRCGQVVDLGALIVEGNVWRSGG